MSSTKNLFFCSMGHRSDCHPQSSERKQHAFWRCYPEAANTMKTTGAPKWNPVEPITSAPNLNMNLSKLDVLHHCGCAHSHLVSPPIKGAPRIPFQIGAWEAQSLTSRSRNGWCWSPCRRFKNFFQGNASRLSWAEDIKLVRAISDLPSGHWSFVCATKIHKKMIMCSMNWYLSWFRFDGCHCHISKWNTSISTAHAHLYVFQQSKKKQASFFSGLRCSTRGI